MAIYLMLGAVAAVVGGIVASQKKRNPAGWAVLCFLIPICVLFILVLNTKEAEGQSQRKSYSMNDIWTCANLGCRTKNEMFRLQCQKCGAPRPLSAVLVNPPEPEPELTRCPLCQEDIRVGAVVCKHCGRDLPEPAKALPQKENNEVQRPGNGAGHGPGEPSRVLSEKTITRQVRNLFLFLGLVVVAGGVITWWVVSHPGSGYAVYDQSVEEQRKAAAYIAAKRFVSKKLADKISSDSPRYFHDYWSGHVGVDRLDLNVYKVSSWLEAHDKTGEPIVPGFVCTLRLSKETGKWELMNLVFD